MSATNGFLDMYIILNELWVQL